MGNVYGKLKSGKNFAKKLDQSVLDYDFELAAKIKDEIEKRK